MEFIKYIQEANDILVTQIRVAYNNPHEVRAFKMVGPNQMINKMKDGVIDKP